MTTALAILDHSNRALAVADLEHVGQAAHKYEQAIYSASTVRAYQGDLQTFASWCARNGLEPMPCKPETLAAYLLALAESGRKVATIQRALAAIAKAHKQAGHASPRDSEKVRGIMRAIRRTKSTAQRRVSPVAVDDLRQMVATLPDSLKGQRDRALLLVGFAGAFRRSELVALDVSDVVFSDEGLTITIRRSKTDQEGEGRTVGLPYSSTASACPVRALRRWLEAAGIVDGAIFASVTKAGRLTDKRLSGRDVARIVKIAAHNAGLDATRYSGHSLRAGLATAAAKAGKSERDIMRQTGHRSPMMVRRYIRDGELFTANNAAAGLL